MNINVFSKQFSKTHTLTNKEIHIFNKSYDAHSPKLHPSWHAKIWLKNTHVIELPFIVKVKLVKTIKSTLPQISYHYVSPQMRFAKSLKYTRGLSRNSTALQAPLSSVFAEILKI